MINWVYIGIGTVIGTVVTSFATYWFKDLLKAILPSPSDTFISIVEFGKDIRRFRPSPDKFLILVARLDGDDPKGTHTRAVARAFRGQQGVERTQTRRVLPLSDISGAGESRAIASGRRWLAKRNADLLIWGEVLQKEKFLNLWFTSKDATSDFQQSRFSLEANLLDGNFTEVASAQLISVSLSAIKLISVSLSAIKPATEVAERSLRDILRPVTDRLRNLLSNSAQFTLRQQSELAFALGVALCAIAREEGGVANLQDAVNLLNSSIKNIDRTREPLAWANVQHYRGVALLQLGEETVGIEILDDAVAAFRSALDERPRERLALDWAKTQYSLGSALIDLGTRKPESSYLIEAIAALDAALTERTQERTPTEWALTTSTRGLAVLSLALQEDVGITKLNEATVLFQKALEATSASVTPILWGGIKLNLGLALTHLAERQPGGGALAEALLTCRSVLSVWTREEVPKLWVKAQIDIGSALNRLAEQETDSEHLKESEDVLRAALEVCTPELSALLWATVQATLGVTLVKIELRQRSSSKSPFRVRFCELIRRQPTHWPTREQDLMHGIQRIQQRDSALSHLEEAVNAFRNSLGEFPRERLPVVWADIQHNFATALTRLGEQEETSYLLDALCRVNLALEVWTYEHFPWFWAVAQNTLSWIFIRLGERQEEPGISRFESAIEACQKASQVQTPDNSRLAWAKNQNYLGIALYRIGEAQNNLARLNEAASAYSSALEVFRSLSMSSEGVENNLRLVQVKIQELS